MAHLRGAAARSSGTRRGSTCWILDCFFIKFHRISLVLHPFSAVSQWFGDFFQGLLEHALSLAGSRLRLLVQSSDHVACLAAKERGAPLAVLEEWSEDMARAIFQPRFIPEEEGVDVKREWRGVYEAVGGHAKHLRQLSELLAAEIHGF